jgi:hypothetical protein
MKHDDSEGGREGADGTAGADHGGDDERKVQLKGDLLVVASLIDKMPCATPDVCSSDIF